MKRVDLKLDVGGAREAPAGQLELAATVFAPDLAPSNDRPIVVFALAGGGYARGYFDMRFAGHEGYSQAEHHAARGVLLISLDPLGVGSSSLPDLTQISFLSLASTYDRAVRTLADRIRTGSLLPGLPALPRALMIGIGQSMGGCITILTQAHHRSFDAIAPLGYSAIHTMLPQRTEHARRRAAEAHQFTSNAALAADTIAKSSAQIADFTYPFHWEDVPPDILAADMEGGYPMRRTVPPFGSKTIPTCAVRMMSAGIVKAEAASITVPVFIGVGERDVCPDPHAEPSAYSGSRDITLLIVPRMAHMHNFAGTRQRLWDRMLQWSACIGQDRATGR